MPTLYISLLYRVINRSIACLTATSLVKVDILKKRKKQEAPHVSLPFTSEITISAYTSDLQVSHLGLRMRIFYFLYGDLTIISPTKFQTNN